MTSTFTELALDVIRPAPTFGEPDGYQRPLDEARADYMAANWDEDLYEPLVVVRSTRRKNGSEYVAINGNHRLQARRRRALAEGEQDVRMTVHLLNGGGYTTAQEQARLYRKSNSRDMRGKRTTQPLSARQDYHAGIVAGDDECVAISRIMAQHHLEVVATANAHGCAITALQWVYRRAVRPMTGEYLLAETMDVLCLAWPEPSSERHHRGVVIGLGAVVREAATDPRYRRERLLKRLDRTTPADIIQTAYESTGAINAETTWHEAVRLATAR